MPRGRLRVTSEILLPVSYDAQHLLSLERLFEVTLLLTGVIKLTERH